MTITYGPFNSGAGADFYQSKWSKMGRVIMCTGVVAGDLNEYEVYGDSSGMQVKVKPGIAWIRGHFLESDAEVILPIAAAHPTYGRIDWVVLRTDWINNLCEIAVLTGTPSGSPAAPTLTQNSSKWEVRIGVVTVDAGVTTIAAGKVAMARKWANLVTYPFIIGNGVSVPSTGVVLYAPIDKDITIRRWYLVANASGNLQLDLWNDTYANFPPTVADTIVGGGGTKPILSAAQTAYGTPTGWAKTTLENGSYLGINIDSVGTIVQATFHLQCYFP